MQMFFLLSAFKHAQNVKINILNGVGKGDSLNTTFATFIAGGKYKYSKIHAIS